MMGLTLAERRAVTETTAVRYSLAGKRTKGIILDELCATTGWHRNHARKAPGLRCRPNWYHREVRGHRSTDRMSSRH